MVTYGDAPTPQSVDSSWRGKILHGTLALEAGQLTGADVPPESYRPPQGFSVMIHLTDPGVAERMFADLANGGTVQMPLGETFWALRFGMLVDQFGIPWIINCGKSA